MPGGLLLFLVISVALGLFIYMNYQDSRDKKKKEEIEQLRKENEALRKKEQEINNLNKNEN